MEKKVYKVDDEFSKALADQIRTQRKRAKISQEDLAEQLGVWPSHISQVENYKRRYTTKMLGKVLSIIGGDFIIRDARNGKWYKRQKGIAE